MPTGPATPLQLLAAFAAALLAAAINSVAGGGTLISFPVLIWLGLPSVVANATSTAGIWPGSLGSIWGFRRELARADRSLRWLVLPSVAGGAAGALLLRATSSALFDRLVPFLVLGATTLFAVRGAVQRRLAARGAPGGRARWRRAAALGVTLAVAVYGGYFGAGMSIMMLAALGVMGLTDILEMNALTSLVSLCVNGVAIGLFVAARLVYWPVVLAMAAGALLGGYGAAGVARRIGKAAVSRFVLVVGFGVTAAFFLRALA